MSEHVKTPLNVVIFDAKNKSRKNLSLELDQNDRLDSLIATVEENMDIPKEEMEIIFCGTKIDPSVVLKDLRLGPTTSLAIRRSRVRDDSTSEGTLKNNSADSGSRSSFFVYCKSCWDVKRAKLRVYCSDCSSNAISLKREPQNWNDVLQSKTIPIYCDNCESLNAFASFKFKCVDCNQINAILTHIQGNWSLQECCVCYNITQTTIDLGCNHQTCLDCFKQYISSHLEPFDYVLNAKYGFTIQCPHLDCKRVVKDSHHFYLMGKENYNEYQKKATEKLVTMAEDGVVCPNPKCSNSFYWEPYDVDDDFVLCPSCTSRFCRKCHEISCTCNYPDDATRDIIKSTTRPCPKCNSPTERNGGCQHIRCMMCDTDWCFKCGSEWTEDCQWDHWF